jgi:anti-sigma-K factor RskA
MSKADDRRLDDLARKLERLPREAWERPEPPEAPWAAAQPSADAQTSSAAQPSADAGAPAERVAAPSGGRRAAPERRWALRPAAALLAAVALLAVGVGAGLLVAGDDGDQGTAPVERRVELQPVQGRGQGASGNVELVERAGGEATLRLQGLTPSARGDFYELWLLGDKGELVSLGSFRVPRSGGASLRVPLPVDPARFRYLDVSREPADGDPGHSSISVLRGPTT